MDLLGRAGFATSDFVWKALVVAYVEPVLPAIRGAGLQDPVEFLDDGFRSPVFSVVNDVVDTAEVVDGLHNVIHVDTVFGDANRVGLEYVPGLLVGEPAALNVV